VSTLTGPTSEFIVQSSHGPVEFEFIIDSKDRIIETSVKFPARPDLEELFTSTLVNFQKKQRRELPAFLPGLQLEDSLVWIYMIEKLHFEFNASYVSLRGDDALLCRCFGVMRDDVAKAIKNGASDLLTITNLTKASGGCGRCKSDIVELMTFAGVVAPPQDLVSFGIDTESFSATKKAKYARENILGLTPVEFLSTHIFPMSHELNFEVLGLVENNLYIKAESMVATLEEFIKEHDLKITTFYS